MEDGDRDQRGKIEAEAIRLWLKSPWAMATVPIFNVVAVVALWNSLRHDKLLIWAFGCLVLTGLRALAWRRYARVANNTALTILWGRRLAAMLAATGLLFAYFATMMFDPVSIQDRMFIAMGVGGFSAAAAAIYGIYMPATLAFNAPVLSATVFTVLDKGGQHTGLLAGMVALYATMLALSARTLSGWVADLFALRIQNERLTGELILAKEAAEAANEAKSVFMANMSHELRTPLNAIIGFAEMMENQVLGPLGTPRYLEYAHDMNASGQHLLSIINTILDLAKSRASALELVIQPVDLGALVRECVGVMHLQADQAGIAIIFQQDDRSPIVAGDETRLRLVIYNLLSNAIKFTDPGGSVTVSCLRSGRTVELEVADTGIGMDEAEIEIALQPFMQVKNLERRSSVGTGLGLPFAKTIAELHGGSLKIASAKRRGTAVRVILPAA